MERGEIDGTCNSLAAVSATRPDWITGKKVTILFQGGVAPNPALKDVPSRTTSRARRKTGSRSNSSMLE